MKKILLLALAAISLPTPLLAAASAHHANATQTINVTITRSDSNTAPINCKVSQDAMYSTWKDGAEDISKSGATFTLAPKTSTSLVGTGQTTGQEMQLYFNCGGDYQSQTISVNIGSMTPSNCFAMLGNYDCKITSTPPPPLPTPIPNPFAVGISITGSPTSK